MKSCLFLLATLAAAHAAPKPQPRDLPGDLIDFIAILPLDQLAPVFESYTQNDAAVSYVIKYLQSDKFKSYMEEIVNKPATQEYFAYLESAGVPANFIIDAFLAAIDAVQPGAVPDENGSLRPFLDEIEALIPVDDLVALLYDKLQNSPDFQYHYTVVSSEKIRTLMNENLAMDVAVELMTQLVAMGVQVNEAWQTVYDFYGWGAAPHF